MDGIDWEADYREKYTVQRSGEERRGAGGWAPDVGGRRRIKPWKKLADKRQVHGRDWTVQTNPWETRDRC